VLLREAESLWRGRPLADLEFEPFARFESQRLETLRLSAVEDRIEAELAVGRHTVLCPELERLVTEHPLRERLRGQLMLALYRSGRQADALETYRAGRSLLVAELAVEPGPELRQLELAILGHDATLQPPAAEQRSATLVSAPPSQAASPGGEAAPGESSAEATPYRRPRRRARWTVLAPGLAAAFAGIALAPLIGHTKAHEPRSGNLLALISPADGAVRAIVPLRAPPTSVAAGFGSVWVAEANAGLVVRVDPGRPAVSATIPVGTNPSRVLAAVGQVWVLDPGDQTLSRIDPQTHAVAQTIAPGSRPGDVLVSAGSLWVTSPGQGRCCRSIPAPAAPRA